MDKRIEISENTIKYHVDNPSSIRDFPWEILTKDIKVIGITSRMLGDDETLFLIIVDSNANKYFITLNNSIKNLNEFEKFVLEAFHLNLKQLYTGHYDKAIVIYPKGLFGNKLYKSSFLLTLASYFGFVHTADGKLDYRITEYIINNKTVY